MSVLLRRSATKSFLSGQTIVLSLFFLFFASHVYSYFQDDVLLIVHDREISKDEFLYHLHKSYPEIDQQNIGEYMDSFIDFHLKLAQAREERVDHYVPFLNELTDYRLQLAAPYLTDKDKEEEFVGEAFERMGFELNANQIIVELDQDAGPEDTLKAYTKANLLRNRILKGESFQQISNSVSDDPTVSVNPGNPGYFTAFEMAYAVESAAYKMNPGELSLPFRSRDGYHIIQLVDRRKTTIGQKNEQEIIDLIYDARDERVEMIERAFVEKLKKYWSFSENLDALEIIYDLADERVLRGNWIPPADRSFNEKLFSIDGKNVQQKQFIEFMTESELIITQTSIRDYIFSLYQQFVSSRLITYENYKLEEKYPEFRFQLYEYRDAMLLLAITRRKVWLKAQEDTAGLEEYYDRNKDKYMWGKRILASIFVADNEHTAKLGARIASKSFRKGETDVREVLDHINYPDTQPITAEQGIFSMGDLPIIDQIKWKKGYSGIRNLEDKYQFVIVHDVLHAEYKSMDEAYDKLFADFQSHLMNDWIDELHKIYDVHINEDLLSTILIPMN